MSDKTQAQLEKEEKKKKSEKFFYSKQSFAIFPQNRYKKDAYVPKPENQSR